MAVFLTIDLPVSSYGSFPVADIKRTLDTMSWVKVGLVDYVLRWPNILA
jgi:hypothetical protein